MAEDAILQLENILREEREAIRRLDGDMVLAFARQKEAIMATLRREDGALEPTQRKRLAALAPALRHNGVLLAHARDVLRDAIAAARAGAAAAASAGSTSSAARHLPPRILSVRG